MRNGKASSVLGFADGDGTRCVPGNVGSVRISTTRTDVRGRETFLIFLFFSFLLLITTIRIGEMLLEATRCNGSAASRFSLRIEEDRKLERVVRSRLEHRLFGEVLSPPHPSCDSWA